LGAAEGEPEHVVIAAVPSSNGNGAVADGAVTLTLSFPALTGYGATASPASPGADGSTSRPQESVTLRFTHRVSAGVDVLELDRPARTAALTGMLRDVLIRGEAEPVELGDEVRLRGHSDATRRRTHARVVNAPGGVELPDA